jgi:hypothetical protein
MAVGLVNKEVGRIIGGVSVFGSRKIIKSLCRFLKKVI